MTTEKLYIKSAADLLSWLDDNPTEPFTIERKWIEDTLASKLETIADKAADEYDAAYQVGYDEGYYEGKEVASSDFENEISELEDEVADLRLEIENLEDQVSDAFAQGYESASQDNDSIETIELS